MLKPTGNKQTCTFWIDSALHAKTKHFAIDHNLSMAEVIAQALRKFLARDKAELLSK
jgi:predicted transcriptional regulator